VTLRVSALNDWDINEEESTVESGADEFSNPFDKAISISNPFSRDTTIAGVNVVDDFVVVVLIPSIGVLDRVLALFELFFKSLFVIDVGNGTPSFEAVGLAFMCCVDMYPPVPGSTPIETMLLPIPPTRTYVGWVLLE